MTDRGESVTLRIVVTLSDFLPKNLWGLIRASFESLTS